MRKSISLTAALAAAALVAPAAAQAGYVTAGKFNQYVAPYPVARYDQSFTLAPNTTQTFAMALPALDGSAHHFQVPCWGYDLVGPGMDLAAAGLLGFGWIGDATTNFRGDRPDAAVQDASGAWILPDSNAVRRQPAAAGGAVVPRDRVELVREPEDRRAQQRGGQGRTQSSPRAPPDPGQAAS